jgi:hypothetical protein
MDKSGACRYRYRVPGNPESPLDASAAKHHVWARAAMWISVALILTLTAFFVFKSLRDLPGEGVDKIGRAISRTGEALTSVAAAFTQGTITTSFLSYATTLNANQYLQFATLRQTEVFTQSDQKTTGFGYIPLPEVIVEARAPVEYTYYLDLNAPWRLELKDGVIHAFAPQIKFNKPAVDASEIQYEVRKGSIFRDTDEAQANLKKSITFLTHQRARENVKLVRETGRKQTAEFIERWLGKNFTDGKGYHVKVLFPGETVPGSITILTNTPLQ